MISQRRQKVIAQDRRNNTLTYNLSEETEFKCFKMGNNKASTYNLLKETQGNTLKMGNDQASTYNLL